MVDPRTKIKPGTMWFKYRNDRHWCYIVRVEGQTVYLYAGSDYWPMQIEEFLVIWEFFRETEKSRKEK